MSNNPMKLIFTAEEVASLKDRADGMLLIVQSAHNAVNAASKDLREAQATLLDVARVARCEIDRAMDAVQQYMEAAEIFEKASAEQEAEKVES
jgi:hypothetical protein